MFVTCTCKQTSTSTLALKHTCSNAQLYITYEVYMHLVNYGFNTVTTVKSFDYSQVQIVAEGIYSIANCLYVGLKVQVNNSLWERLKENLCSDDHNSPLICNHDEFMIHGDIILWMQPFWQECKYS